MVREKEKEKGNPSLMDIDIQWIANKGGGEQREIDRRHHVIPLYGSGSIDGPSASEMEGEMPPPRGPTDSDSESDSDNDSDSIAIATATVAVTSSLLSPSANGDGAPAPTSGAPAAPTTATPPSIDHISASTTATAPQLAPSSSSSSNASARSSPESIRPNATITTDVESGNIDQAAALLDASVPVSPPYRHNKHRLLAHELPKGILKPAPVAAPRFSFRRDVLSYVGDSIASVAGAVAQSTQAQVGPAGTASGAVEVTPTDSSSGTTLNHIQQHQPAQALVVQHQQPCATQSVHQQTQQQPAARGSAFWKRLGGAVTAVTSQMPAAQAAAVQRTLHQFSSSSSPSPSPSTADHPSPSSTPIASTSSAAAASSGPVHAAAEQHSSDTQESASVKSVRFTMAALTVVYPLSAGAAPGTEADTRKRVNLEYRAKQRERRKKGWTSQELLRMYDECCRTREEPGIEQVGRALMVSL